MSRRLLRRTMIPVAIISAVLLAGGVYGAWRVHRLDRRSTEMLSDNVASIRAAEELETIVREIRYRLKRYVSTADPRHVDQIRQMLPRGAQWLSEAERLALMTRERQLVERAGRGYQQMQEGVSALEGSPSAAAAAALALNLADEVVPNKILVYTQNYIDLNEEQLTRSSERGRASANRLMTGLLILGTCGGLTGMLAGLVIARRVSRTIVQLSLPIRDTAGKLNEVVGPITVAADPGFQDLESVLQIVSQRVAVMVERLHESEREMLRAEQLAAVGQLAAGLAHELRNPLTSMKTIIQLGRDSAELTARDLEVLEEETARLERSVQDLLDFARPPRLERRETDLGALLEQTADLAAPRALRQRVRLEYEPPWPPVRATVDPSQFRQVVLNLVLNAVDETPPGGVIRLTAGTEENDDGRAVRQHESPWAVIRVADTGPGLPEGLGERIFEPFVSTKATGTGLGLSICRRIVEAHGGEIVAENGPRGGALFTVRTPLHEAAASRESLPANTSRQEEENYAARG